MGVCYLYSRWAQRRPTPVTRPKTWHGEKLFRKSKLNFTKMEVINASNWPSIGKTFCERNLKSYKSVLSSQELWSFRPHPNPSLHLFCLRGKMFLANRLINLVRNFFSNILKDLKNFHWAVLNINFCELLFYLPDLFWMHFRILMNNRFQHHFKLTLNSPA